jgi:type IV pilus assembly protein PilC
VKGAIAYPAVILVVAILIVIFMILKIVPIFKSVYDKAGAVLPLPTRILIAFSNALRDYLLFMLLGLAFVVLVVYAIYQSPGGRRFFDRMKLQFPLFGSLIRKGILARTCRTLSVLLNAGIPLIEAMETVAKVSGNAIIEDALTKATQRMRDGGTIADTLRETGEFPGMVTQLVATGEESGTLRPCSAAPRPSTSSRSIRRCRRCLAHRADHDRHHGRHRGSIIFALYLPIFNLGQAMKGGVR